MRHFLLFYVTAPDYLERRPHYRSVHIEKARAAKARGDLILAGALADPADQAVLLFQGADKSVAEDFAKTDPYVTNGLITSWTVREWTTVIGDAAAHPLPPGV
jgi:uncharacterized protein YciI